MTTRVTYEDFALKIQPLDGGESEIRVVSSPYGAPDTRFRLPFPDEDLPGVIAGVESAIRARSPAWNGKSRDLDLERPPTPSGASAEVSFEELGAGLFHALFHGPVKDSYLESRVHVEETRGVGLRLRLVFDPERPGSPRLLALPWELLYQVERREFLARGLSTPVVRYLEVPRARVGRPVGSSLRILIAVAAPRDLPFLDVETECRRLEKVLGEREEIQLETVPHATAEALHRALRQGSFDVLHFVGHGGFREDRGEGSLLLESAHGDSEAVPGSVLVDSLRSHRSLRLVCLNACETARIPRRDGQDPFTGVASALLMGGLPAVLAMQFPISDGAAIAFSDAFYSALAAEDPADAATTEGRLAILRDSPDSWEWATPVLFLSVRDGAIFKPSEEENEEGLPSKPKEDTAVTRSHRPPQGNTYRGDLNDWKVSGGTVHVNKTETTEQRARIAYDHGLRQLEEKSYDLAEKALRSAVEKAEVDSEAPYYLALSILGGDPPRLLTLKEVEKVEELLGTALDRRPAHHLLLLALVKHDYYTTNGMNPPEPGPRELLRRAKARQPDPEKTRELLGHLSDIGGPIVSEIRKHSA